MAEPVAFSTQEFKRPPLVEVLLAVSFSPIEELDCRHIADLYKVFSENYPEYLEKPPLDPVFEVFSRSGVAAHNVSLQLIQQLPLPRIWMMDARGEQLIQFQKDRVVLNWKKSPGAGAYPRYDAIRENFVATLNKVDTYLASNGLKKIDPNQCEISYINHIHIKDGSLSDQISNTFSGVFSGLLEGGECEPEDIRFMLRHIIKDGDSEPIGRLITSVESGISVDGSRLINFTLTARGRPSKPAIGEVLNFLDRGRKVINWSFLKATSEESHARWGKVE